MSYCQDVQVALASNDVGELKRLAEGKGCIGIDALTALKFIRGDHNNCKANEAERILHTLNLNGVRSD